MTQQQQQQQQQFDFAKEHEEFIARLWTNFVQEAERLNYWGGYRCPNCQTTFAGENAWLSHRCPGIKGE